MTQSQAKELLEPPGAEGGRRGVSPRTPKRGGQPSHTLILDFWPAELGENKFLF